MTVPSPLLTEVLGLAVGANPSGGSPNGSPSPPRTAGRGRAADSAAAGRRRTENARGRRAAACTRIAHRLRGEGLRIVGFVPADPRVAVAPFLVELGLALCELTGTTVAVVDANARHPSLPQLARRGKGSAAYSTRWVDGALAVLSPARAERAGEVVPRLARVLLETGDLFGHLLVDLTGFERLGEHATAAACMDALAIVCRAHATHERAVRRLVDQLPHERFLGVVLVDT